MKKYGVHIHGESVVFRDTDGELRVGGFHTIQVVNASHPEFGKALALRLVRELPLYKNKVKNTPKTPPRLNVEEVFETTEDAGSTGIVFYVEKDEPVVRYYIWKGGIASQLLAWARKRIRSFRRALIRTGPSRE